MIRSARPRFTARLARRAALAALLGALLALAAVGAAQRAPGTVVELIPTGPLTPAQIDARTSGRFRNDGERPPQAVTTVDTYLMRYVSRWADGTEAEALAQLIIPRAPLRTETGDSGVLLAFAPGSTGLVEACAPSRGIVEGGGYETYGATTLAYAGQGFVAVMPNYLGFFDVGTLQPYFVADAEAHAVLDALRATPRALSQLGVDLPLEHAFAGGYSQGGHAVFAAADRVADYAPEVPLAGVLGFGATTRVDAVFEEFTYVAPWILYAWSAFYPDRVDPSAVLLPGYARQLADDAERLCIAGVQRYYPSDPDALFLPEFLSALRAGALADYDPELAELMEINDAGLAGHGLPAMVLQGVNDPVVDITTQDRFVAALCERGSAVRYPNYLRTRHETRYIGFRDAIGWMRALAGGEAPPSDCAAQTGSAP